MVKESNGAIIDATIIESSRRPRKVIEVMPEDRKTLPSIITYSDDATWIKKGKKAYYGYKAHASTDTKDEFILGGHVTPAHVADTSEFDKLIASLNLPKDTLVLADKGYCSDKNRRILNEEELLDGIMHKAVRNRPLTFFQRLINRLISSVRYKVEQSFGTLKKGYRFSRMRYIGIRKGNMEFLLNAMAFNLKKAALKID